MNWKTFETLPNNGQVILVTDGFFFTLSIFEISNLWRKGYELPPAGVMGDYIGEVDEGNATHWCEVPELPKTK